MGMADEQAGGILVPVDFSPSSLAALCWAAEAAHRFDWPLEVLHVVHDPAATPGYYQARRGELERLEEAAAKMLDDFVDKAVAGNPNLAALGAACRTLVVGLPVTRILEVAERRGTHLIVMGSQGRSGLPRLLLGSKAQRVVQQSPIPVTIVKAGAEPWPRGEE